MVSTEHSNPYSPATLPIGNRIKRDSTAPLLRLVLGILAFSGLLYLPTVGFLVTIPGAVIWIHWVNIAAFKRSAFFPVFWIISFCWNFTIAVFLFSRQNEFLELSIRLVPLGHSILAAVVSLLVLRYGSNWIVEAKERVTD